jgi:hypothetical protein
MPLELINRAALAAPQNYSHVVAATGGRLIEVEAIAVLE